MDPDATLVQIRDLVKLIFAPVDEHVEIGPDYEFLAVMLAMHVTFLDSWMIGGGFAPAPWDHHRQPAGK